MLRNLIFIFFFPVVLFSQTLVKGVVLDSADKKPIENAIIKIISVKDSTNRQGTSANKSGEFELRDIGYSKYKIIISFIGYSDYSSEIKVNGNTPQVDLGKIFLNPSLDSTATIEVNAERYYFENKDNMKVYNVEKNMISESGTASDVLKSIPSVTMDSDGRISIRGNSNVVFLINGNQSGILSSDPNASLDLIPANMIESIEIINNPSSKYESEGITGIVNIVLKKNTETEKSKNNFSISLNAGTQDKYNFSANANIKRNKYSLTASYNFRLFNMSVNGTTGTTNFLNDTLHFLNQVNNVANRLQSHTGNLAFGFFPDKNNEFNISMAFNNRARTREENTFYRNYDIEYNPVLFYGKKNIFDISGNGLDLSAFYKKTFSKEHFINIASQFSYSKDDLDLRMKQSFFNTDNTPKDTLPYLENDFTESRLKIFSVQGDYTLGLENIGKIEAGIKGIYRENDSYFNVNYYDYASSNWENKISMKNDFEYKEYINSVYGIYSGGYRNLSYQAGIRIEQTNSKANQLNINFFKEKNYIDIFPSLYIKQIITNKSEIAFNYSRRINRPGTAMLNPFVNNADPQVLRFGNPDLQPEYINSFELTHNYYFPVLSVTTSLFFRNINDVMTRYIYADNNGTSYFTYKNLAHSNTYGVELLLNGNILKWWYFNSNLTYLKVAYAGNESKNSEYESWVGKINCGFKLPGNFEVQFLFNYQGKTSGVMGIGDQNYVMGGARVTLAQGFNEPDYYLDIAIKKDFFNKKLTVVFKVIDILNTSKFKSEISDNTFYAEYYRKRNSRMAFLTFTYRFGSDDKSQNGKKKLLEEHTEE